MNQIKVLIIDPHIMCRHDLKSALENLSDIAVLGTVATGKAALHLIRENQPDLVVISSNMSDIPVVTFTQTIAAEFPQVGVLLATTDDIEDADKVIQALEQGAFDFILKPNIPFGDSNIATLRRLLLPKIRCFSIKRYSRLTKQLTPKWNGLDSSLSNKLAVSDKGEIGSGSTYVH